jgi:hypothetical protein
VINGAPVMVKYSKRGFPIMPRATFQGAKRSVVQIPLSGSRTRDYELADAAAGMSPGHRPANLVWHHHEAMGVMVLVEKKVHEAFGHVGGVAVWEAMTGQKYRT